MAALTSTNASYVIDETVAVLAFDEFIQPAPVMPALYNQQASSKDHEARGSISALGDFEEKVQLAEPAESIPVQQFKKDFLHREFALQTKIERKVIDDARFDFFSRFAQKLGESAVRTFEKYAAKQFNEAFSTSSYAAEDALSLCNAAHVNADGGNSIANRGTTALSYSSVGSTRVAMKAFTDYVGNKVSVNPDLLIVPNAGTMEQTAYEIVRSSGDPTNGNNVANFHNNRFGVVVWNYLTDANNWFMADSSLMRQNLVWWWRMPLEIFGDGSLMKGMRSIGGYYRSSHGVNDWRWIYGHEVT